MSNALYSAISRFTEGTQRWAQRTRPLFDRVFARWLPPPQEEVLAWASDADWARMDQEPLRARYLLRAIIVILTLLLIWAAFATVDEVTRGSGKVIPTRQVQVVQAVDGGVVAEILVREGQLVEKGQTLFRIDETRFVSSLRENRVQYLALLAKAARLRALAENTPFTLPAEILKEDPKLVEEERNMYDARRRELEAQLSIARQQLAQRNQELVEMRSRREQMAQSYELTARELTMTKPLAASGARCSPSRSPTRSPRRAGSVSARRSRRPSPRATTPTRPHPATRWRLSAKLSTARSPAPMRAISPFRSASSSAS